MVSPLIVQQTGEGPLTGDDPELPEHDQSTSNARRSHLGGVDGDGGILGANPDTHDEAGGEQALP